MKHVVVILDGAAGWPLAELGGKTTLQAAATPNLDSLARGGTLGLARTVPEGEEPSSSAACTSIFGYDPIADFVGRGAIEAASMGIQLEADQIALRLNTVTTSGGVMMSYACGHIATEESRAIIAELETELGDDTFRLYPGVAYRHILVVTGHPELLEVRYTPPHDISGRLVAPHLPKGSGSELLVDFMERARTLLGGSEINRSRRASGLALATDVWPFWPGAASKGMVPFSERRGLGAAVSSGVDLLNGLAVLARMTRLDIPGVTGGSDNDYAGQAAGSLAALADHDLVVVHVESPDEEGHAGDVAAKIAAIEAIDREVVSRVMDFAETRETRVLAMPDHPTPIPTKTHASESVPFVMWGPRIGANGGLAFSEIDAEATGLVLDPGRAVMDELLR